MTVQDQPGSIRITFVNKKGETIAKRQPRRHRCSVLRRRVHAHDAAL